MRIRCRAFFPANGESTFGVYGLPQEPDRRIYDGEEFQFEYDEDKHQIRYDKKLDKYFIGSWVEVLDPPQKKKKANQPKQTSTAKDAAIESGLMA